MNLRIGTAFFASVLQAFLSLSAHTAEKDNAKSPFPSVGEQRLDIIADKVEAIGCILDKDAIRNAKDGETVLIRHKEDRRGDVTVVFNHIVLPKGNWVLYGAKDKLVGDICEALPGKIPKRMEAVSAVLTGNAITTTPRTFENNRPYRSVFTKVSRYWGWNIGIAHSSETRSSTHSFDFEVPSNSKVGERKFENTHLPIVNILHRDDAGALLAGGLYWFQNANEKTVPSNPKPPQNRKL
jgi:hypothetical protein